MLVVKPEDISELIKFLKIGKIIVFPTETSYGLGCDAANREAVEKIFKIKNRERNKSMLVVVPDIKMAKKYLVWNETLGKLAGQYWPGSLTVVGEYGPDLKGGELAKGVVSEDGTLALRVTAHPFLKSLTEKLGYPLVATSANLAGAGEVYNSEEIREIFSGRPSAPDVLVDGGGLPKNKPTTVVSVLGNNLKILRQGELKISNF